MNNCPLCSSSEYKEIEKIDHKSLLNSYKRLTLLDFSSILNCEISFRECICCGIKYFDPKLTGDEVFYKSLQKFDWYYVDNKNEYSVAKEYIKENDFVLDVGCGKGAFAKYVSEMNGHFLGLDFSENARILAAKDGIEIRLQSIQKYAKDHPQSVDVVTSFQVGEHVSDVKEFVEAQLEALKSGGCMIIAVPSEGSFLSQVTNGILNMPPHHITRWHDQVFTYIANKYNLDLERLYHEKLQDIHVSWYLSTLVQNILMKPRLLDESLKRKLVSKFAFYTSKVLIKRFKDYMKPDGHTVIAVYRKK